MRSTLPIVLAGATLSLLLAAGKESASDWRLYGGPGQTRYSSLKQINRSNVMRLKVAWTYDTADGPNASQTQPIVVNGVLYGLTPRHKTIALDAATGKLLWRFDSGIEGRGPNRSVTYWSDGAEQRIFASIQSYVYALDARTGKAIPSFGDNGRIDLRENLGRDPEKQSIVPRRSLPRSSDSRRSHSRIASRSAGRHSRLRCPHRETAVVVPHYPASGRVRLRHVAQGSVDVFRRSEQLGGHVRG